MTWIRSFVIPASTLMCSVSSRIWPMIVRTLWFSSMNSLHFMTFSAWSSFRSLMSSAMSLTCMSMSSICFARAASPSMTASSFPCTYLCRSSTICLFAAASSMSLALFCWSSASIWLVRMTDFAICSLFSLCSMMTSLSSSMSKVPNFSCTMRMSLPIWSREWQRSSIIGSYVSGMNLSVRTTRASSALIWFWRSWSLLRTPT
mmetsp:Transcript_24837/g.54896  ORF Transcript_24837/g.54896 Transcript_24837/m.54896 type:complete len:203 (+) Transcript_24837:897-1505(+)